MMRVTLTLLPAGFAAPAHLALTGAPSPAPLPSATPSASATVDGIHKIQHVVVIMQENRSFDSYFGTYPGADGIPMQNGVPTICAPDPHGGSGVSPYHDPNDLNHGGPHGRDAAIADIDGGKMDGFLAEAHGARIRCADPNDPRCANAPAPDVMGYHDQREIPNYWTYAQNFVLQDRMFEPHASWSLPEHLFMVSEWSARCSSASDPMSCVNALQNPGQGANGNYAWTDLTYLMYKQSISWKYYVAQGTQPDCEADHATWTALPRTVGTPESWNPLPWS